MGTKTRKRLFLAPQERHLRQLSTWKFAWALGMVLGLGSVAAQNANAGPSTGTAFVDLLVTYNGALSVNVDNLQDSTSAMQGYSGANTPAGNPNSNAYASPITSMTVTNNGGITERWELDVSTVAGGANWQLNNATGSAHANGTSGGQLACTGSCPAAEQYSFQALFVSSKTAQGAYGVANGCPSPNAADWDQFVTTVPAHPGFATTQTTGLNLYNTNQYADSNANAGAGLGNGNPDSSLAGGPPNNGDMLPLNNTQPGTGQRGLCVRMTMPSTTVTTTQQTVRLEISAIGG